MAAGHYASAPALSIQLVRRRDPSGAAARLRRFVCGRFTSMRRLGTPGGLFEAAGPDCIRLLLVGRVRIQLSPYDLDRGCIV